MKNSVRRYDWTIAAAALLMVLAFGASQVAAQADKKSDKKSGFSVDRSGPIKIQSTTLEVRDKEKKATFKGSVHVVQGETEVRCNILVVFYDTEAAKAAPAADGKRGSEQIRYMEAQGNVVVTQKDQTATGDSADFDMRSNTVTLKGNVVVTRGHDVLRGQRLVVDLTTGVTKMESGGGRVEGLFRSSNQEKGKPAGAEPKKDDRNDPKRRGAGGPTGLY